MNTGFYWENLREGDHSEDRQEDGIILKLILRKVGWEACTGQILLRTGAGGGLL